MVWIIIIIILILIIIIGSVSARAFAPISGAVAVFTEARHQQRRQPDPLHDRRQATATLCFRFASQPGSGPLPPPPQVPVPMEQAERASIPSCCNLRFCDSQKDFGLQAFCGSCPKEPSANVPNKVTAESSAIQKRLHRLAESLHVL